MNNEALLEKIDRIYPSKSKRPKYQGKPVIRIIGIDANDMRPIVLQIQEPNENYKSWKDLIDALEQGYQVILMDFPYIVGAHANYDWKTRTYKEYPNNIHADAITKYGAIAKVVDSNDRVIEWPKKQAPGFFGLFDHPYEID
jgi:hypothetical protein